METSLTPRGNYFTKKEIIPTILLLPYFLIPILLVRFLGDDPTNLLHVVGYLFALFDVAAIIYLIKIPLP